MDDKQPRFNSLAEIKTAVAQCDTVEEVHAMVDQSCTINCMYEYYAEFPDAGNRNPVDVLFEATRIV